ncbi:MAG: DUF2069 domain-containing protein [Rubrivivax sp.]|nr:DUF2069 domain-containing protein [Rubrivivax sp.]
MTLATSPDTLPATAPDAIVRGTRIAVLAALLALIALGLAWELWLAPTGSGTLAIKVLPLLLCLGGLLRHRMYTYRWLSLLIWLYFMEGVVRASSESGLSAALAWGEIGLSLVIFGICGLHIRWRQKQGRLAAAARA